MIELNKIFCESCMDTMARMEDKSVDLVITSPQYNLGNNHHTGSKRHNPYDDDLPEEEYQEIQIKILNEIYRVLIPEGSLFYNHKIRIKNFEAIHPMNWINKTKLKLKQEINWENGTQNFDNRRFYPFSERIYWLCVNPKICFIDNKLGLKDNWLYAGVGVAGEEHTRAFPPKIPTNILSVLPNAQIVYDPFMGSGTTALSAIKTNRNFIGSEISQAYVDLANKRIDRHLRQEKLF